jgi:hypothetical protein
MVHHGAGLMAIALLAATVTAMGAVPIEEFASHSGRGLMWDDGKEEVFYGHLGPGEAALRLSRGAKSRYEKALSGMHADGVGMTRLFVLYDMRNMEVAKALPPEFYEDLDCALRTADEHDVNLVITLYDFYLARQHPEVFHDPTRQKAVVARAVEVAEYLNHHPSRKRVVMIDITNEPDSSSWITHGAVGMEDWRPVLAALLAGLRRATSIPLTIGFNARAESLGYANLLTDKDFLCWHYYHDKPAVFDISVRELRKQHPEMGTKQVLLEEYGALDARDQEQALTQAHRLGYCGILFWKGIWKDGIIVIFSSANYRRWLKEQGVEVGPVGRGGRRVGRPRDGAPTGTTG